MAGLIWCDAHKRAPAALVCVHLARGLATDWNPLLQADSENTDWVCG